MWRIVFFSLFVAGVSASCNLYINAQQPGIFTRKFGSNRLLIPARSNIITIDDNIEVTAYCSGGFRYYSYATTTPEKQLIFSCASSGGVVYRLPNSTYTSSANSQGTLACPSVSSYFETTVPSCQYYGLAYGFFVGDTAVILAETCYDLNMMQARFSHYVAGVRTSVLEAQVAMNVVNVTSTAANVDFGIIDTAALQNSLNAAVKSAMPNYASVVNYVISGLIPIESSFGVLSDYTRSFEGTNLIAWWQPLKFGNWKLVEDAIARVSMNEPYDVYAGISNVLSSSQSGCCMITDQLTYTVNQYIKPVPLYVWNYVKPRNNSSDEGVVIVGINSPFLESGDNSQVLCTDICDTISWLDAISVVRDMPSLGYIFCCKPSDVKNKLDNFPQLT